MNAAQQCGWNGEKLNNLFDLLKSDLTIVNDLSQFYKDVPIPSHFKITGPIYSQPDENETVDKNILRIFGDRKNGKINLFCTMGSSGKRNHLIEAAKTIITLSPEKFNAVVLVPKAVCSIDEIANYTKGKNNIYLTDQFVPAKLVNELSDIVISHGGQGTLQTAMASGTPVIGFAMQPEQQINLDHIVEFGAGIRIPMTRWNEKNIKSAVNKITADPSFKCNAEILAESMASENGKLNAAVAIWSFIQEQTR